MHRILLLIVPLLFAAPAVAQQTIAVGQTVTGELTESDPEGGGGRRYDAWRFEAQAGRTYLVTLRSEDFDAYLWGGPQDGNDCNPCYEDDDGSGGVDAMLALEPETSGPQLIRAGTWSPGEGGRYTLTVEEVEIISDPVEIPSGRDPTLIPSGTDLPFLVPGRTKDDALQEGDYLDEGGLVDPWTYFASAGETATFELATDEFDGVLRIGTRDEYGEWREVARAAADGGTRARHTMTFPERADYEIRVGAARPGQTGAYTLYSHSSIHAQSDSMVPPGMIADGQTLRGALEETDALGENGAFADHWDLGGGGRTLTIDLRSDAFDPLLRILVQQTDGGWRELVSDDDGGVGTDSRLTIDLPHPSHYRVQVTTYRPGDRGEYVLSVRSGPP